MPTIEVRALTGKAWDPQSWNGDIREDPDEAGDMMSQNSDASGEGFRIPCGDMLLHLAPPMTKKKGAVFSGLLWILRQRCPHLGVLLLQTLC